VKRFCAIVLLGSIVSCSTKDEKILNLTPEQRSQLFFWTTAHWNGFRDFTLGRAACEENLLVALLGGYSDQNSFVKIEENQEITSSFSRLITLNFEPRTDSMLAVEITEALNISSHGTINCDITNSQVRREIRVNGCINGNNQRIESLSTSNLNPGQIWTQKYQANIRYWISVSTSSFECRIRVRLRSFQQ